MGAMIATAAGESAPTAVMHGGDPEHDPRDQGGAFAHQPDGPWTSLSMVPLFWAMAKR